MMEQKERKYWISQKNWGGLAIVFFLVMVFGGIELYDWLDIKYRKKLTIGSIVNVHRPAKGFYRFECVYYINDILYREEYVVGKFRGKEDDFLNEKFPVAYSKTHPEKSRILANPKEFDSFEIPIPDSLEKYTKRFY